MQANTTNKNSVYSLCSLPQVSAYFYDHHQVVAQLT